MYEDRITLLKQIIKKNQNNKELSEKTESTILNDVLTQQQTPTLKALARIDKTLLTTQLASIENTKTKPAIKNKKEDQQEILLGFYPF